MLGWKSGYFETYRERGERSNRGGDAGTANKQRSCDGGDGEPWFFFMVVVIEENTYSKEKKGFA